MKNSQYACFLLTPVVLSFPDLQTRPDLWPNLVAGLRQLPEFVGVDMGAIRFRHKAFYKVEWPLGPAPFDEPPGPLWLEWNLSLRLFGKRLLGHLSNRYWGTQGEFWLSPEQNLGELDFMAGWVDGFCEFQQRLESILAKFADTTAPPGFGVLPFIIIDRFNVAKSQADSGQRPASSESTTTLSR